MLQSIAAVSRSRFLVTGVVLFAMKFVLDRLVARYAFGRSWSPIDYLIPTQAFTLLSLPPADQVFFATMTAMALPFVLIGVVVTVGRLRDAGLSPALAVLFFPPVVNLLFFVVLSVLPSKRGVEPLAVLPEAETAPVPVGGAAEMLRYGTDDLGPRRAWLARVLPAGDGASRFVSALIPVPFGLVFLYAGVHLLENYGWGIFVGLPFATGLVAAVLHGYRTPRGLGQCLAAAMCSQFLLAGALIATALEGAVCIIMAAPLLLPVALLGGALGHAIQRRPARSDGLSNVLFAMVVSLPMLLGAERLLLPDAPVYEVTTSLEIDAAPDAVWPHVVAFPSLPEPTELPFRMGLAYPKEATIVGRASARRATARSPPARSSSRSPGGTRRTGWRSPSPKTRAR